MQNFLFANRGKRKWQEIALAAEVGFSANGQPRSGMGVDSADFNGDGKPDLFVANVDQEMFSLYRNDGNEFFSDVAALSSHDMRDVLGIGAATKVNWIEIKWPAPSGRVERLTDLPIDRYVTIVEGQGRINA